MTEKTCNQFIKEMKLAGFSFKYRATDGKQVFTGEVKAVKENKQENEKNEHTHRRKVFQLSNHVPISA